MNIVMDRTLLVLYKESKGLVFADIVEKQHSSEIFSGKNYEEIEYFLLNFKIFEEVLQTQTNKIFTLSRGYLAESFEKFIIESHQHGIINYLDRQAYPYSMIDNYQYTAEPNVLTIYMLSAGFIIWLVSVCLAILVFVGEHIKFAIESHYQNGKVEVIQNC